MQIHERVRGACTGLARVWKKRDLTKVGREISQDLNICASVDREALARVEHRYDVTNWRPERAYLSRVGKHNARVNLVRTGVMIKILILEYNILRVVKRRAPTAHTS